MSNHPWIPITGKDAGPHFTSHLNPAHIIEATFWTDPTQKRVVSLQLSDGRKVDLREPEAIAAVGTVTRGTPDPDPEPLPIAARACARR